MTDTTTLDIGEPAGDAPAEKAAPFRWRLANRPDVRFGHAAGGVAGILVAAAVVAFVVAATGDEPRVPGVAFTLALIIAALGAGFLVRGPVRSAAVSAIVLAVPLLWVFAILGGGDGVERGDFRLILLLTIASYVLLYLLTWTRGRAILLGLALLFAANWIVFEVASQDVPFAVGIVNGVQSQGVGDPTELLSGDDKSTEAATATLVIAVVLLGTGIILDRRRRAGAATPLLLVGGLYAVNAAIAFGEEVDDVYAAGIFVALAGLAIGLAGSLGRRRGTSWIGSIVVLAGALTLIAQGTEDTATSGDGTAVRFAIYALLGAAVLLAVGIVVARQLDEPVDGGEPATRARPSPRHRSPSRPRSPPSSPRPGRARGRHRSRTRAGGRTGSPRPRRRPRPRRSAEPEAAPEPEPTPAPETAVATEPAADDAPPPVTWAAPEPGPTETPPPEA